jgi:S-formylglutathione hydrolase
MPPPAWDLQKILDDYGIEYTFEIYEGDHSNRIPERFGIQVFPFFTENPMFK